MEASSSQVTAMKKKMSEFQLNDIFQLLHAHGKEPVIVLIGGTVK
jgi:hypothetical protein